MDSELLDELREFVEKDPPRVLPKTLRDRRVRAQRGSVALVALLFLCLLIAGVNSEIILVAGILSVLGLGIETAISFRGTRVLRNGRAVVAEITEVVEDESNDQLLVEYAFQAGELSCHGRHSFKLDALDYNERQLINNLEGIALYLESDPDQSVLVETLAI